MRKFTSILVLMLLVQWTNAQETSCKVLNFYGDNGFVHLSQQSGLSLIEDLGHKNGWEVLTTNDTSVFSLKQLLGFDVVVFNNNCGNKGAIFSRDQKQAFQQYIRNGGGFLAIHCAGAIWKEGGAFQQWYEELIGAKLVDHPKVQSAKLIVEDTSHESTQHLSGEWEVTDEWHRFSYNPRESVQVLISVDENSYEGEQKMGGDHPFVWYQYYDGGRSFFTSLGHTKEIYKEANFQQLIEGGIKWAAGTSKKANTLPVTDGLLLDLDADHGVLVEDGNRVIVWENQVTDNGIRQFSKQDEGREVAGSGRPRLKLGEPKLNGHNSLVFHRQELLNEQEDAFDHLIQGSGYTWISVMCVYEQIKGKPGINAFFGNLRNSNVDRQGQFEGFWGGVNGQNEVWMSSRNALQKGSFNDNNPQIIAPIPLEKSVYYIVLGRMGAGTDTVKMELFVNDLKAVGERSFPVNPHANPSKMAIGQERDATNHPGAESFDGEMARFLIFEKPLSDEELQKTVDYLRLFYGIKP